MPTLKLDFHNRKRLRQKQSWPILKANHPWLKEQLIKTLPRSKLAEAIQYTLNQWPYLIAYLRHSEAEIDTNCIENKIRLTALGKKNWLFIGNEESREVHALFYSLVLSVIMNDINPRVYIHYLLDKIHEIRTEKIDPTQLLPHLIDKAELRIFAGKQIVIARQVGYLLKLNLPKNYRA